MQHAHVLIFASLAWLSGCDCACPEGDCSFPRPGFRLPSHGAGDTADTSSHVPPPLFINEFMASNDMNLQDDDGEFEDWIEIFNGGGEDLDLLGYSMTDDLDNPTRHVFSDSVVVPAGGWVLLFADRETYESPRHLSFCLKKEGESIGLYAPDGSAISKIAFNSQATDRSAGRVPDGGPDWFLLDWPTPGATNGSAAGPVPPPGPQVTDDVLCEGQADDDDDD